MSSRISRWSSASGGATSIRWSRRPGERRLPRSRRTVQEHALRRRDPPSRVEIGIGQRDREPPELRLRLPDAADVLEGDRGPEVRFDPPGKVAELLAELCEDVLETPLERPLVIVALLGVGHGQMDGPPRGGRVLVFSKTRSSTSTGTFARIASAIASEGRASSCISPPFAAR